MINVRRVLVKAEMEKFLQSKELYTSLKKGKVRPEGLLGLQRWGEGIPPEELLLTVSPLVQSCCCCQTKFTLFSWPPTCLFCKR